jgi:hypothetical protein
VNALLKVAPNARFVDWNTYDLLIIQFPASKASLADQEVLVCNWFPFDVDIFTTASVKHTTLLPGMAETGEISCWWRWVTQQCGPWELAGGGILIALGHHWVGTMGRAGQGEGTGQGQRWSERS